MTPYICRSYVQDCESGKASVVSLDRMLQSTPPFQEDFKPFVGAFDINSVSNDKQTLGWYQPMNQKAKWLELNLVASSQDHVPKNLMRTEVLSRRRECASSDSSVLR